MSTVEQGRACFERRAWGDAFAELSTADEQDALDAEDLDLLAQAAYLTGRDLESVEYWTRAHHSFLDQGDVERAVRSAFWLGLQLMLRGEHAQGGGWLARAQRLVEEGELDCVECGYLLMPAGLQCIDQGDLDTARAHFARAVEIGERFGDPDLITLGRLGGAQARIRLGRSDGVPMLDEVMVAVTAGEVSAKVAGIVYCAAILAYQEILDVGRAQEWTSALSEWCEAQPDLVPFRGVCLVHRSQVLQLHGAWQEALEEAHRARERLAAPPPQPAVGMAFYQLGELHRLRGEVAEAERAYREANACGHSPHPGLALLRLAQGRVDVAASAIRGAIEEAEDVATRARALAASVEIMLAARDVGAAREGAEELHRLAEDLDVPLLRAMSAEATGSVLLAEGDARGAQGALRSASAAWRELDAPYEIARAGVLIGLAARELGDEDTATMELDAARARFEELDAAPDLARLDDSPGRPEAAAGLTARELEVLRLVAAGKTNRAIATELVISEKTVARHVSNIFNKVGVSSRAAATAFAYEHDLVTT